MIRADPQLYEELALCDRWAIPHSRFLTFSTLDQGKALAFRHVQAQICSRCGTHPDDFDPAQGGNRNAWIGQSKTCEGCRRIHLEEKGVPDASRPYTHVWVAPEAYAAEPDEREQQPRREPDPKQRELTTSGGY